MTCISPLQRHRDCACDPAVHIAAAAERHHDELVVRYRLTGLATIVIPSRQEASRADGLWRHTCFEAFIRGSSGEGYVELNFSPSGQWAAYMFSGYRSGMANAEEVRPEMALDCTSDCLEFVGRANLGPVPQLGRAEMWHVGLAAVIEETGGRLSYWALVHPTGKPDFHHRDGFALALSQ